MALPDPDGLDALSLSELPGLIADLIGQVRALTDENRALRDEVARLKGLSPRPPTRPAPSGLERASERAQAKPGQRRRGPVHERGVITREVVLKAAVPAGSRFKGYEDVVVRDLVLEATVIRYRPERWSTQSRMRVVAALQPGIVGGFGPHLRRFLLAGRDGTPRPLTFAPEIRVALLSISVATIDWALRQQREHRSARGRQREAASTIRRTIPVRTFSDWGDPPPGFVEADLVTHSCPSASGAFVQMLVLTDIAIGVKEGGHEADCQQQDACLVTKLFGGNVALVRH